MSRRRRHPLAAMLVGAALGIQVAQVRPAYAVFGEEDWLSGQNQLLIQMLAEDMKQVTQLMQVISNLGLVLKSINETVALARTMKRVYEMVTNYDLQGLMNDAKAGLFRAMPELREIERESEILVENGQAAVEGQGRFFSRITYHDARVSEAARRTFEHGYQAAIWPHVFPEAMTFRPDPTPVEALIQERYRWTEDARRRAFQRTAMSVLANKIGVLVRDAESKDNAELRTITTNAQIELQSMENLTELRNLEEQRTAIEEAGRKDDAAFRRKVGQALGESAGELVRP